MTYIRESVRDMTFVENVRTDRVLEDIDPERLRLFVQGPTFLIGCGDCMKRFWECMAYISRLTGIPIQDFGFQLCVHNGAPLYLRRPESLEFSVILKHYREARDLNRADRVMILGHGPCGAAGLMRLDLEQSFDQVMEGGLMAPKLFELPPKAILTTTHLDKGPNEKRLYRTSVDRWVDRNGSGLRAQI